MASDLQIKQQRAELRRRFFLLLQNEVPEGFDRAQTEKDLRELAAGLVLKGVIAKDRWEEVSAIKNHDQQLLEIIELVLSAADEAKDENPAARMEELTAALKEHQKQLAQEAEIKKAEHPNPAQQTAKIIEDLARANARLRDASPQAAEGLEDLQEVLAVALVASPESAIPTAILYASALAQDNPRFTNIDATDSLGPLVEPAQAYNQQIDTLVTQIANELPEMPAREDVAQVLTAYKLANPQATLEDFKPLIEKIELRLAVEKQAVEIPQAAVETAVAAKIDVTPEELISQAIQAKLQQAGVPKQESQQTAQMITKFAPAIHYISSYAPSKTPDEYKRNKEHVTKELTNHVVDRFLAGPGSPRALLRVIKDHTNRLNYYELFTRAYGAAQYYQYQLQAYEYPVSPATPPSDPFLTFLVSYGQAVAQDVIIGVTLDAVVAGPIGAWILPDAAISAAFIFDAGATAVPVVGAQIAATTAAAATAATTTVGAEVVVAEATTAVAATGLGASITAFLTTLGIADPEPITKAILLVVDAVIVFGKQIWDFIKKIVKNAGVPLLIGAAAFVGFLFTGTTLLLAGLGAGAVTIATSFLVPQIGAVTGLGPGAWLQPLGNFAGNLFTGLTELAVVEIGIPIIMIIISIPVVVALLLFIINNSAFVVPPAGFVNPSTGGAYTGPLPEGCPSGWPTDHGHITQGAWVSSDFRYRSGFPATHVGTEAIDDGVVLGTEVKATHKGVAITHTIDASGYGNYIEVHSTCLYKGIEVSFFSRYAHLTSFNISDNSLVEAGQLIGFSGSTGNSTGPHLHYEFRHNDNSKTHYEEDVAPFMWPNFIPETPIIDRGCIVDTGNPYTNQCNASW